MEFLLVLPDKSINCMWLDAYMGLLLVDMEGFKGSFITIKDVVKMSTEAICLPLKGSTGIFS
jgi:hypothetical protein